MRYLSEKNSGGKDWFLSGFDLRHHSLFKAFPNAVSLFMSYWFLSSAILLPQLIVNSLILGRDPVIPDELTGLQTVLFLV